LEFEPDQPYVLNYLAYSWVDKGKNYDRALTMLNKAVEQKPEDGYIVDSLGWVYYRLGKYDLAVEQLERAIELVPQDSVINDHLGDAYWRVGRHNEARFQWRRALNLEPEKDQVAPIESKLEKGLPAATTPSGT
jgi:Flp pilus assembly protein TadD